MVEKVVLERWQLVNNVLGFLDYKEASANQDTIWLTVVLERIKETLHVTGLAGNFGKCSKKTNYKLREFLVRRRNITGFLCFLA